MNTHTDKSQENKSQLVANTVSQKLGSGESTSQFLDNRPETVSQRKLHEIAHKSPQVSQLRVFQGMANGNLYSKQVNQYQTLTENNSISQQTSMQKKETKGVVQRLIKVGEKDHEVNAGDIVNPTVDRVWGQLTTWMTRSKANKPSKELEKKVKNILKDKSKASVKVEVARLFSDIYDERSFVDIDDLGRQAEQDVMLKLLGLESLEGTEQQLDQFTFSKGSAGAGSTKKSFRVYRTMKFEFWNEYENSGDVKTILHGHGGALGQALHYFQKSIGNLDDVLVEFAFNDLSESQAVDYNEISKGGEGKGSKGGKLGAKSEKNDVFAVNNIFSVDLGKNKVLIDKLKPTVKAIKYAIPENH